MSIFIVNAKYAPKGWTNDPRYVDCRRSRSGRVGYAVGSPGWLGNPFTLGNGMPLDMALTLYEDYLRRSVEMRPDFRRAVLALKKADADTILVCACAEREGLSYHDLYNGVWICHCQPLQRYIEENVS